MNKTTLAAFTATVALAVPASLVADIQSDGPALRPERKTVHIGDATVSLDLDRGVMLSGKIASAVLVATSERPHDVTVDVTAMEDMGYGGERVPNPPREVGKRTLRLHAEPGGGPPAVASFTLDKRASKGTSSWFDIHVRGRDKDGDEAVASVATWGGNEFPIAIEPPATIPATGSFTVAVRIKNTSSSPMGYVSIQLGDHVGLEGLSSFLIAENTGEIKAEQVTEPTEGDDALAPGAERLAIFRVDPQDDRRHLALVAIASSDANEQRLSAMEVTSFDRPDAAPADDQETPIAAR